MKSRGLLDPDVCADTQRHGHIQIYLQMWMNAETQPDSRGAWAQRALTMERSLGLDTDVRSHACQDTQSWETTSMHAYI